MRAATCAALVVASGVAVCVAAAEICEVSGTAAPDVVSFVATVNNPSVPAVMLHPDCTYESASRDRGGGYAVYSTITERVAGCPPTPTFFIQAPLSRGADLTGAGPTLTDVSIESVSTSASAANFAFPSSVKKLRFAKTGMSDFELLKVPTSVTSLTIQENPQLKSLKNIKLPASLTTLDLRTNQIGALDFALPSSLQMLYLTGNPITKLDGTALSTAMTGLSCDGCQITSVRGVKLPRNLMTFSLGSEPITTFEIRKSDLPVLQQMATYATWTISQPQCADKTADVVTIAQGKVCVISDERFNEVYAGGPATAPAPSSGGRTTPSPGSAATTGSGSKPGYAMDSDSTESSSAAGSSPTNSSSVRKRTSSRGTDTGVSLSSSGAGELAASEQGESPTDGSDTSSSTTTGTKKSGRTSAPGAGDKSVTDSTDTSTTSKGAIIGVAITGVAIVLVVGVVGVRIVLGARKRRADPEDHDLESSKFASMRSPQTGNSGQDSSLQSALDPDGYLENDVRNDKALSLFRIDNRAIRLGAVVAHNKYRVIHRGYFDGQKVAIRQMLPDAVRDQGNVTAFMDEIRMSVSLEHPKIVRCFGICWTNLSDVSVVTEYMAGRDLHSLLQKQSEESTGREWFEPWIASSIKCKTSIAADVAEATVYLHSFNTPITHRHLRAKTVLIDKAGNAKLNGFGVGRNVSVDDMIVQDDGAVAWMAPEVLRGEAYSEKADIYSLGVLLVELDRCRHPYFGLDLADNTDSQGRSRSSEDESNRSVSTNSRIAILVSSGKLQPKPSPSCLDTVQELISECLSFEPAERPNAMEVHHALRQIHKAMTSAAEL